MPYQLTDAIGWKVWTSDAVYNSVEHKAADIPADVQVVTYYFDKPYRNVEHGNDFYALDGVTLVGREISYADFEEIARQAYADEWWPE